MLATANPNPGVLPTGPDWTFEVKWDGMRILADVGTAGSVCLTSRNGNDATPTFPEVQALAALGRDALLDGEIVALDSGGRVSFDRLSERLGVASAARAAALARHNPVTYVIFDLLRLDGDWLPTRPFRERRDALETLVLPQGPFLVPQTFKDGEALLRVTRESGLEGVVAKRWDAPYRPGVRSAAWIKQSHRSATDAVVIGWRVSSSGAVASLALATRDEDGALLYRGTAGSGISRTMDRLLLGRLAAGREPPTVAGLEGDQERLSAEGFTWAAPDLIVEIRHLGLSSAGRFRQPVVARVRTDLTGGAGRRASADAPDDPVTVAVAGRQLRLNHLDKVLYPAAGTTKAEVIEYFAAVAPQLLRLAAGRPITRRRWPDGVTAQSFFEKNLPTWAPEWIRRVELPTSAEPTTFPVLALDDIAAVIWLAAHSALELHTPQWTVDGDGRPQVPDRLVVDLDPGPGAGLSECAAVAELVRAELVVDGLAAHAVLSGSKGLHVYAPLSDPGPDSDAATERVRQLGERVREQAPHLVVVTMAKAARVGRVFLDWSQNRAAKTTLAPWSLRGTALPQVALPVSWDEVASGELRQVALPEALRRLADGIVPLPW